LLTLIWKEFSLWLHPRLVIGASKDAHHLSA
jgi:hypothetical protein